MSCVAAAAPLPELYYQPSSRLYWRRDAHGRWFENDKDSAKKFVIQQGRSGKTVESGLSPADECLLRIQEEQNVAYAGPLAGRLAGSYTMGGRLVLVTDSPAFIAPRAGDWPVLHAVLEGLLNTPEADQRPYLYGWLKIALESLRRQRWCAGQALALAGPVRGGKSLLQLIITRLLGGRSAHPYQYMTEQTTFNADLFRAEHLVVDDQAEGTDIRTRKTFSGAIKPLVATKEHRCHPKHGMPIVLEPIWRMSITLNDDPERLLVLPPLDADFADKLMLLKTQSRPMPMPTDTPEGQEAFWNTLVAELPAFVAFLEQWQIPEGLRCPRFGIRTYHHPELVLQLQRTTPESRLMELIDLVADRTYLGLPWEGTASELTATLTNAGTYSMLARDLLKNPQACGSYLSRLARSDDSRVTTRLLNGDRLYAIAPRPETGGQVEQVYNFNTRERRRGGVVIGDQGSQLGPLVHLLPQTPQLSQLPPHAEDPARN